MSKSAQFPFNLSEGFAGIGGPAKEALESMSHAYADWLSNANRVQTEMIRFMGDRFTKDANLISRFAGCRQPDEFLRLQAEAMTELASDYMQEGARIFTLFSDASRGTFEEFAKATKTKRTS